MDAPRRERVAEVRRWLANYQELKEAIEAIYELNHDLLRPEAVKNKHWHSDIQRAAAAAGVVSQPRQYCGS